MNITAIENCPTPDTSLLVKEQSECPWTKIDTFAAVACSTLFAAILLLWFVLDHRVPGADEAGHILNALIYKELWKHPKFWKLDWLQQMLSVSSFYPPFVYMFNGLLKLVLGSGRAIDIASMVGFSFVLSLSTYGIARLLTRSTAAALLSVIVLNLYPQIAHLSHVYLLDYPLASMVALGLVAFLWWHESPSWQRAIATGLVLAAACMSKQIAAGFLFLPGCWCLWRAVVMDKQRAAARQGSTAVQFALSYKLSLQVLSMAALVLAVFLPWLLVNYNWIKSYAQENAANMGGLGVQLSAPALMADYLVGLWHSMSPLLGIVFLLSVFGITVKQHGRLMPLYLMAFGGLVAISVLTCTFPLDRYAASLLIAPAVVTAWATVRFLVGGRCAAPLVGQFYLLFVTVITAIAAVQFVSFSFSPLPLSVPWLAAAAPALGVYLREFRGVRVERSVPIPESVDWGQQWAIDKIKSVEHNNVVWLNILPSHGAYNPHSFELLAKEGNANVKPTTSRYWTIVGDRVSFSPHTALYYQWYLLKTGEQGNKLCDVVSEDNYKKLIEFVSSGAHFHLQAQRKVADGSTISLYKLFTY